MSRTRPMISVGAAALALGAAAAGGVLTTSPGATAAGGPTSPGVSECRAGDVHVSYRDTGAGMSHRYGDLVVENTSSRTCSIQGYGGLSYVGGGDGTQVGAPATRTPGPTPRTSLRPGHRVVGLVEAGTTAPYSRADCRPEHVDGFRVFLPDETHSLFVAHPTTGCTNPRVSLLDHRAFGANQR